LSQELSPPVLHHSDLIQALEWLARQMDSQFGLQVALEADRKQRFDKSALKVFLFRAVQELLFNVVKHAGVKSASLVLAESADNMVITVSDEGHGFNVETLASYSESTGFGLLSLKERSRHIGCHLCIESAPEQGCRVTLAVPHDLFAEASTGEIATEFDPHANIRSDLKAPEGSAGIRVLIADDHTVMRKGLIKLIAAHSHIHVVGEAADGKEAIEMARRLNPDVLVMDVSMPEMDGVEAAGKIRSELPGLRIVGLSMFEDEHVALAMQQAGAEAFVSKTASSEELLKAIYGVEGDKASS